MDWFGVVSLWLGAAILAIKSADLRAVPGSPPFVELGHAVEPQTELCLIEVMKLFTTLKAGAKGTIKRVCAKDGAMVEFGDILFYIEPS